MKGLRLEWLGDRHYSVALHFGESFVPVEDRIVDAIAREAASAPDRFLEIAIEKIGSNPYLRNRIRQAADSENLLTQISAMKDFIRKYKI